MARAGQTHPIVINARFSLDQAADLARWAESHDLPVSTAIRFIVEQGLKNASGLDRSLEKQLKESEVRFL